MPWKDKEKRRAAIRRHYYANRSVYIARARKRRLELRRLIDQLKEASPCKDCKVNYPYFVMDFDHIGEEKNKEINKLINAGNSKKLREEIALCELVCSNCHRFRTQRRLARKFNV